MESIIVPICIFTITFFVVCIVYDLLLRTRMSKRMRETWDFINNMRDFVQPVEAELPERIPF